MDPITFIILCIASMVLGTCIGIFTGLVPGIHTNTVAAILVVVHAPLTIWLASRFGEGTISEAELAIVCFLVAVAMAHVFVSYIPATFLGAPEEGTVLSVLPGHRMLLQGRGLVSIRLSAQGGLAAVLICLSAVLVLRCVMGGPVDLYARTRPFIPFLLMLVVLLMILTEGQSKRRRDVQPGREPATCLLVDEVRFDSTEEDPSFFEVWTLWGLHGKNVTTKGRLVKEKGRIFLEDRGKVELLFKEKGLRKAMDNHIGETVSIEGRVCRSLAPSQRTDLRRMAWALAVFLMAGSLGIVILDSHGLMNFNFIPMTRLGLPAWGWEFLPLFTGLFGLPTLLTSLSSNPAIPVQLQDPREGISRKRKAKGMLFGAVTGAFMGWFPGITSSQAGVLAAQASSDIKDGEDEEDGGAATEEFMVSLSAINTANAVTNFVALFVILRTRSGAAKATQDMLGTGLEAWTNPWPIPSQLLLILLSILISSVLAYFMTIRLGRLFAKHFHQVPYRKLVASVIVLLVVLVLFMAGPLGLAIMAIATFLGLIPPMVGVRRVHLIGCLILPILASWAWGILGWGVLM